MKLIRSSLATLCLTLVTFSFSARSERVLGGTTFQVGEHRLEFKDNWKVVESGYQGDKTAVRECSYFFGDFTLWDEEGLEVTLLCDGQTYRFILSPESDYLSRCSGASLTRV